MSIPVGSHGLTVKCPLGYGAMGTVAFYVPKPSEHLEESTRTIVAALEKGMMVDTAFIYMSAEPGAPTNEGLVGQAVSLALEKGIKREDMRIATKFGIKFGPTGLAFDSSPETMDAQLAESLRRLGPQVGYIDLYYQHRVDPSVPMEVVANKLKEYVASGKVRHIGLSEASPDEIRAVHAIIPVSAIQVELSLSNRDAVLARLFPVCKELGIAIVAYSPLGRGLLTGRFKKTSDLVDGDWRKTIPRFSEENLASNASAADKLAEIAGRIGATPGQLALAWIMKKGQQAGITVVPIPGTKTVSRLEENAGSVAVVDKVTDAMMEEIEAAVGAAQGERYAAGSMSTATWESRDKTTVDDASKL